MVVFDPKKIKFFFSCNFFLQLLVIKALDPDWIRIGIQPKMLDLNPDEMMRIRNPGFAKQCSLLCVMCFESLVYGTVHNTGGVLAMQSFLKNRQSNLEPLPCGREIFFVKGRQFLFKI
jgi:hypothetical protein